MRFLGTSILPRVLFLVTLFGVSSGAAYFWIRSSQEQIVENQRLATVAPSPGSSISPLSEVQRGERSDAQAPNPSPEPTPATDTTIPSLFSQLSSGINTVAQMVVSGSSSLTYQGGTSDSGSINANKLQGSDWSSPAAIGVGTANTAVFSDVTSTGTLAAKGPVTMSQFTNGFLIANGIGELSATRVSLSNSSHVADRLPTASGGTGNDFSGSATGSVLSFSATGQMTTVAPGTAGYVLTSNGAGALPTWSSPGSASVDWNNPGTIGGTTPNTGSFTQLSAAGASTPLNVGSSSQLQVDNNGRMTITYVGDSGSLSSSGGALFFNQTNNTGTGIGIYSNAGAEALGNMINVKVDNPLYSQAAFYMNYDGNSNAVEIVSNADDASSNALAVTGNNIEDSTVGIIGYELARGTIKISHYRPGSGNDSSASGISIDLKGSGTRAQGLYVDSTEPGGTLGNLLRLRNESVDKFVVNYQGNLAMAGNLTQGAAGTDTTFTKQGNNSNDQFFVGTTGAFRVQRSAANSEAFRVQVAGDSQGRWLGTSDGQLKWGPGSATQDVVLKRSVAGVLTLDGVIVMNNSNQALDTVVKGSGDDNLLHVDASTDRIGMGLSAPLAALHISKNTGTLPSLILNNIGTGDLLTASSSGTTQFVVSNTGSVGAGTRSPAAKIEALSTTEQLRLSYDGTNSASFIVDSSGSLRIDPSNTNNIVSFGTGNLNIVGNATPQINATNAQISIQNATFNGTSSSINAVAMTPSVTPASGSLVHSTLAIATTVSQTGGANGITRGLYINPTLSAAADWRSLEIANNSGYAIYQSGASAPNYLAGNVGIGAVTPSAKLDIQGGHGGNAAVIINQTLSGPILTASSSGTTRFTIANTGAVAALGDITQGANGSNTSFTKFGNSAGDEFFIGTNGAGRFQRAASNSETLRMQVSGDTQGRLVITSDGKLNWGAGNAAQDLTIRRSAAGVLAIDGSVIPGTDATYNLGSTAAKWANIYTGNAGVGATTFGTSAANVLAIANSTAPSASITDGIQLYAVDVTGSHELRVRDEAGNVTTLSPHNFSLVPGGRSEALAWSFYSERNGLAINADMTKALRILEDVSGEQLVFLKDLNTGDNVQVFQRDGSLADRVSQNQEVISTLTAGVLIEESGWSFLKSVVFQAQARFDQVVEFARQVRFQAEALFEQAVVFQGRIRVNQDTAGVFNVPAGATKVRISFHQAFSKTPLVSLSAPQGLSGNYHLEEVAKDGFVVALSQAQLKDLTLQWWAVESEAGQAAVQVLEGAVLGESSVDASPSPAASPAPSVQPSIQPSILPSSSPSPTPLSTPLSTPSPTPSPSVAPSPEVSLSPEPSVIPNASSQVPTPSPSSQP